MVDLARIRDARILEGLTASDLAALAAIAEREQVRRGERLFVRGEAAERFYIVENGGFALTVLLRALDDRVETVAEELGAGDAFGWSALVEPRRSIYSGYCTSDGTVVSFPGTALEALMATDEGLGFRLSVNLNRMIGTRVRVLQDLWIAEVEQSTSRVKFWSANEVSRRLTVAVHPPRQHRTWRHPIGGRRQGPPSAPRL
jgi:CRP-like cAMP-binding protein